MENNNSYEEKELIENRDLNLILNDEIMNRPRIGDMAPLFTADSTDGPMKLSDYTNRWVILFSHAGDFTPVCTTEFIAFARMHPEFEKRNCALIGLSIDSTPSHIAWMNNVHRTTGVQIPFPIISDSNMVVAKKFGMISPNVSDRKTIRSVFIIDPIQKIRLILEYPMQIGRNVTEILRVLDALQTSDKENIMTPANWMPGQPCLTPSPKTYSEMMEKISNGSEHNCIDWYLCFDKNMDINMGMMPNMIPNMMFQPHLMHMHKPTIMEHNSGCMSNDINCNMGCGCNKNMRE